MHRCLLLDPCNLAVLALGLLAIGLLVQAFHEARRTALWARLAPVSPMFVTVPMVVGVYGEAGSAAELVVLGLLLGSAAANIYKIVQQTILGHDRRIRRDRSNIHRLWF